MKSLNFFTMATFAIVALCLASCGGSKSDNATENEDSNALKVEVVSTKISGELGKYFEIITRSYKIEKDTFYEVNFEIKRIAEGLPESWTDAIAKGDDVDVDINVQFLDRDGNILEKSLLNEDIDELAQLSVGDATSFSCYINKETVKEVKTAKFSSKITVESRSDESDSDSDKEFDEALEDYNKTMEAIGNAAKVLKSL